MKTVQLFWRMRLRKNTFPYDYKQIQNKGRVTNSSHGASALGNDLANTSFAVPIKIHQSWANLETLRE